MHLHQHRLTRHLFCFFVLSLGLATVVRSPALCSPIGLDVSILRYGVYFAAQSEMVRPDGAAHELVVVDELRFEKQGRKIVARKGVIMGLDFKVQGRQLPASLPIDIEVTHPSILPPGRTIPIRHTTWRMHPSPNVPVHAGWMFKEDWEMVAGAYIFRIKYQDRTLASQVFQVSLPASATAHTLTDQKHPAPGATPASPAPSIASSPPPKATHEAENEFNAKTLYYVQVAAHREKDLALGNAHNLSQQGHPTFTLLLYDNRDRPWYIVALDPPYRTEAAARQARNDFRRATHGDALVKSIQAGLLKKRSLSR